MLMVEPGGALASLGWWSRLGSASARGLRRALLTVGARLVRACRGGGDFPGEENSSPPPTCYSAV